MDMSTEEEAQLIRYMLNDLPQDECERIEELYFKDDAYFEALTALETQLVRDWLAGSLTPKQAAQFEARMHQDAALREHVAVVEALAGHAARGAPADRAKGPTGVMRYFLFLREMPAALALAGCCVFLAAAVLTVTLSYVRINRLQAQMATLMALQRPVATPQGSGASDPTFSLLAGITRSATGRPPLFVPASARLVHLQFLVPGHPADILRIALRNPDNGAQSWSALVPGEPQVEVAIPAGLLQPGDYVLSAETAAGEMIESWQFRVVR
jgi:hypothetical protein